MIEMTNKNLSELFDINFAKWKRWNREFIECYQGAGTDRGYLKLYTPEEAFAVYLGGYLVTYFRFSIQEAKAALKDLLPWIENNFFPLKKLNENMLKIYESGDVNCTWIIKIIREATGFSYEVKKITTLEKINDQKYRETYILENIESNCKNKLENNKTEKQMYIDIMVPESRIAIDNMLRYFCHMIELPLTSSIWNNKK